ncbi:MAG: NYN domain-containing protein [Phormidesmis sp.]
MKKINTNAESNRSAEVEASKKKERATQNADVANTEATTANTAKLKPRTVRKVSSRISTQPLAADTVAASEDPFSNAQDEMTEGTYLPTEVVTSEVATSADSAWNEEPRFSNGFSAALNSSARTSPFPSRPVSLHEVYQSVNHSSDRIAIFIDGSNLFYAASHLNIEVDYRRLLASLVRGRRLLRAYFYTGVDPQNEKQRGFLLWLNRHGHRVVSKELAHLPDGSRKANMHVEMAVDMMRIAEHCSTLTLLGGDGNLSYALQVLSQRGTMIEVVSLQSMTSDSLIDLADSYTDLADLRDEIKR